MSHRQPGCFEAGRKTENTGCEHTEVRAAGSTSVAGDPVEAKRKRVDRGLREGQIFKRMLAI